MSLRSQLVGRAAEALLSPGVEAARRRWHRLRRSGRPLVELFHQVDDPHGHLLTWALARYACFDLRIWLVPPPERAADPAPELRRRHALADARELARRHGIPFPAQARTPSRPEAELAETILASEAPSLERLREVGEALFAGSLASPGDLCPDATTARLLAEGASRRQELGHYAGGALYFEGEWYLGVDRLHYLTTRLRAEGLDAPDPAPRDLADAAEGERGLTMYFSFRSPYSYLALERTIALSRRHAVPLEVKVVLPMVMRGLAVPSAKARYLLGDAAREARRLGIPFGRVADPLGEGVLRCMAVHHRARRHGLHLAFLASASRGIWAEGRDVATDRDLRAVAERAGLSWSETEDALGVDAWRAEAEASRAELTALGLWGVPSFRVGERVSWGQDRLDWVDGWLGGTADARASRPPASRRARSVDE